MVKCTICENDLLRFSSQFSTTYVCLKCKKQIYEAKRDSEDFIIITNVEVEEL